jgi:tetratricopeptide (TPR) repeat protein
MDLSWLKWLVIVLVIFGVGWLVTAGGVNYMYNRATAGAVGVDAGKDKVNEATLTRYGGFLLSTFRYEGAKKFYNAALQRYPSGNNRFWNRYQLARCHEKLDEMEESVNLLLYLHDEDANQYDSRIPNQDTLKLRIQKLIEVNQLDLDPFGER